MKTFLFPLTILYSPIDASVFDQKIKPYVKQQSKKVNDISSIVNDPNYIEQDSKTRGKILDYLRQHPEAILTDLAKELQISYKGVEWHFTRMKKEGLIKHIGPNNGGHWEVVSENNK